MNLRRIVPICIAASVIGAPTAHAQRGRTASEPATPSVPLAPPTERVEALKKEVAADVESRRVFTQQLVDSLFSYTPDRRWSSPPRSLPRR